MSVPLTELVAVGDFVVVAPRVTDYGGQVGLVTEVERPVYAVLLADEPEPLAFHAEELMLFQEG